MARADVQEFLLNNPPTDGISNVCFGPNNFLIVSSWDSTTRLYDTVNNNLRATFNHSDAVLDCGFVSASTAVAGGLDGQVKMFDFNTRSETVIGQHSDAIKTVEWNHQVNLCVTGSWDKTVKLWDPRQRDCVSSADHPDRIYTMGMVDEVMVVVTGGRRVLIWDIRNMSYVSQRRESALKFMTRCIRVFPNKKGYVLSSCEGRVAVEYLDSSTEAQKKKYAFKCHRIKEDGMETIYPVNIIAFHRKYNTFATGGCDGFVNVWDSENKKRLCQLHRLPTSIASLSFNEDGNLLAIASSYTFELGDKEHHPDQIYIRNVSDQETRPKSLG